jgi:FHS family Na+ dependent glucose MFS transporter 1
LKDLKRYQTAAYFVSFIALGLAIASLGPTLPGLAAQVHRNAADISYLFVLRAFGFFVGSLLSGRFYDRMSGHGVMAAMIVSMSVTLALMPMAGTLGVLLSVMLLLGIAEGALGVGGNALLVWVHQSRVAPFMNALHFCYGVGAFVSPLVIHLALKNRDTTTAAYLALAVLVLPSAIWLLMLPSPRNPSPHIEANSDGSEPGQEGGAPSGAAPDPSSVARVNYKVIVLVALLLGLYTGAEVSYGSWIYSYVLRMNIGGEDIAAYLTSAFWGSLTAGRLLGVPLAAKFKPGKLLLADLFGCFASLAVALVWSNSATAITVASIGAGLSMASIYPMALSLAERRSRITGKVTGYLLLGGSVGVMVVPFLIGQMFDKNGPRVMMITILFDLIGALAVYLILAAGSSREYRPESLQEV